MTTMTTLKQLRDVVARLDPWLVAIVAVGAVVALYYGFLGARYYQTSSHIAALQDQIQQLTSSVRSGGKVQGAAEADFAVGAAQMDQTRALFSYQQTDDLVNIVLSAAEAAGVTVRNVNVPVPEVVKEAPVTYTLQPVALAVAGPPPSIYRFLQDLEQRAPVVKVASVSLSGEDGAAQVRLQFYLSPVIQDQ